MRPPAATSTRPASAPPSRGSSRSRCCRKWCRHRPIRIWTSFRAASKRCRNLPARRTAAAPVHAEDRRRPPCSGQRLLGCFFRRQAIVELVGEPLDLLFDVLLRLFLRGAAGDEEAFDFDAPVDQIQRLLVQLFFFLCHGLPLIFPVRRYRVVACSVPAAAVAAAAGFSGSSTICT